GFEPKQYSQYLRDCPRCKTQVEVFVHRLDSVVSSLSYDYSYFDFCEVKENESSLTENFEQVLFGIRPSPYTFKFLRNEECKQICIKNYSTNDSNQQKLLKRLMKGSKLNYQQRWTVDNMPFCYKDDRIDSENCSYGFPIGGYITKSGLAKHS
ncbi:unnamed protein product, partial [Didymodactylos carnosus]